MYGFYVNGVDNVVVISLGVCIGIIGIMVGL